MLRRLFAIATMMILVSIAHAQRPDSSLKGCWKARALPTCDAIFISEASLEFPAFSTRIPLSYDSTRFHELASRGVLTVGGMFNLSPARSFALTAAAGSSSLYRYDFRYRWWLTPESGIDASVGYARISMEGPVHSRLRRGAGPTIAVGLAGPDLGLDLRLDALRTPDRHAVRAVHIGAKTSGRVTPVLVLFAGAFLLIYIGSHPID